VRDAIGLLVAFQQGLFPRLESDLGPMGERYELFVAVLELVRVEALLPYFRGQAGRPEEDRAALARASATVVGAAESVTVGTYGLPVVDAQRLMATGFNRT